MMIAGNFNFALEFSKSKLGIFGPEFRSLGRIFSTC